MFSLGTEAVVVPVPMNFFRQARRGFNQAEALAGVFAELVGAPLAPRLLGRRLRLRHQAELDTDDARRRNAAGSFNLLGHFRAGQEFVLVDDVATSGATLQAAAATLKAGGAGRVSAVVFLRR